MRLCSVGLLLCVDGRVTGQVQEDVVECRPTRRDVSDHDPRLVQGAHRVGDSLAAGDRHRYDAVERGRCAVTDRREGGDGFRSDRSVGKADL
jgi:hypothetical protein